jgi:hypothetical protein
VSAQPGNPIIPSSSDYAPMRAPELNTQSFAQVDNCPLVTAPSGYSAAMDVGCGQVVPAGYSSPAYGPVTTTPVTLPAEIPSSTTVVPPSGVTVTTTTPPPPVATTPAPARALMDFGQTQNVVQIGKGLWGQPKAYVPGQNCRNWLRYFFP